MQTYNHHIGLSFSNAKFDNARSHAIVAEALHNAGDLKMLIRIIVTRMNLSPKNGGYAMRGTNEARQPLEDIIRRVKPQHWNCFTARRISSGRFGVFKEAKKYKWFIPMTPCGYFRHLP
jgi:hypothetical protein